ncbi:MAG: cyclopropane-fatty-acyl-phospholipid synthase family protein [Bryobacteraceae bacterium]
MNYQKLFLTSLNQFQEGCLTVDYAGERHVFGSPEAELQATALVHDERFFRRAVLDGDIGLGESYMAGEWSSPDLTNVIRIAVRNLKHLESGSRITAAISRLLNMWRHRKRSNTVDGSRENIHAHYDLSNDFFRLFLDPSMMYSCGFYAGENDTLEEAQFEKLDRICRKLRLTPADHVLEIGTGWGAFALHAARHYGCRVTTTTISREQHDYAQGLFACSPEGSRITLLLEDYRKLEGQYSRIVSIEMFEAVGLQFYDDFFGACDRLLAPDGSMLLQSITMNEHKWTAYRKQTDWIQKYIFPGSELASVSEILHSLRRATKLSLFHLEDIGAHYARTLAEWRRRFRAEEARVRALGFDDTFLRMWDYYLSYCEASFAERHIGDVQVVLVKNGTQQPLYGEPWGAAKSAAQARA